MANNDKGKISVSGFKLDPAEKAIVDNLINNYRNKIAERFNYKEIRLRMKKSQKGKTFLHEVQGEMLTDRRLSAKAEDYNLFSALSEVFEKLMHEAEHNKRTARQ